LDGNQRKPSRDLSDLKARLGLAKGGGQPAAQPPPPGGVPAPGGAPPPGATPAPAPRARPQLQTGPHSPVGSPPAASSPPAPFQPPAPVSAVSSVVPPAGLVPPTAAQPQAAPPPDARRDPFAAAQAQIAGGQTKVEVISDAGPALDIPKEEKSHKPLIIGVLVAALVALGVGYTFGNVMHARQVFNKTIDDAQRIEKTVGDLQDTVKKLIGVLNDSAKRNKNKIRYDKQLVAELRKVQEAAPLATLQNAQKIEDKLFRTNYALMDDMVITRLFRYFNNSLRLIASVESFLRHAESNANELAKRAAKADKPSKSQRNYGLYIVEPKPELFLGGILEVGPPTCADKRPQLKRTCKIAGFFVREVNAEQWSWRPSKPDKKVRLEEIVIPLHRRDPGWRAVAATDPGARVHASYIARFRAMQRIAALLKKDHKPLKQDLAKQSSREKVFTF